MSENAPQFSIVIPTYNRAYVLPAAITSVQNQTRGDWEVIVVDDGSADDSKEVIEQITAADPRVRYISQKNFGASAARNRGRHEARGKIIVYLDSDDTFFPTFLQKVADAYSTRPNTKFGVPNHYRHIVLVDEDNKITQENASKICHPLGTTLQDIYFWNAKVTASGIFHQKILDPKIVWDETLQYGEDWDFILQCGALYADHFFYIPEPLVCYVQKYGIAGQCANATYADWAKMFSDIYKRHKDDPLLVGQTWYPDRVERYTKLQAQVEAGLIPPAMYKYFPDFNKK